MHPCHEKGTKEQRLVAVQDNHHPFLLLPDYWEAPDLTDEDRLAESDLTKRLALFGKERSGQAFVVSFLQ